MADTAYMLDDGRVGMDVPCQLLTTDAAYPATLSDLSFGGACVSAPGVPEFMPRGLMAIELGELGTFDVVFRWRRGDRIGVSFRMEHDAHARLERFFAAHGIRVGARA